MKKIASIYKRLSKYVTIYRLIVGIGFIIAMVLILVPPLQMPETEYWAYYYGVKNFSQGQLTIDSSTLYLEALETQQHGSMLVQYLPVSYNKWALEKSPGSVFYLVPFYKMGILRWSNVLLALGMVMVTFILPKKPREEKAAMKVRLLIPMLIVIKSISKGLIIAAFSSLAFLV